jgi:hypothetical protein
MSKDKEFIMNALQMAAVEFEQDSKESCFYSLDTLRFMAVRALINKHGSSEGNEWQFESHYGNEVLVWFSYNHNSAVLSVVVTENHGTDYENHNEFQFCQLLEKAEQMDSKRNHNFSVEAIKSAFAV